MNDYSILDLSGTSPLSAEDARAITALEPNAREEFNNYIEVLSCANNFQDEDWFTCISSRNTLLNKLLLNICRLQLLEQKISKGDLPDKIFVHNRAMKTVVKSLLAQSNLNLTVQVKPSQHILIVLFIHIVQSIRLIFNFIFCSLFYIKDVDYGSCEILIDTFINQNSFDETGHYSDRYYGKLIEEIERENTYLLPHYLSAGSTLNFLKIRKFIYHSKFKFISKEDFLTFSDYLYILKTAISIPIKPKQFPHFGKFDITPLLKRQILEDIMSPQIVDALINYRFTKQLKTRIPNLKLLVDWNENQIIDRSLILGLKKNFPNTLIRGYQAFIVPEFYTCMQPTKYEYEAKLIPHEIYLIGEAYLKERSKYLSNLLFKIAPAYRFNHLFTELPVKKNRTFRYLVALPMMVDESLQLLNFILGIFDHIPTNYEFILKFHPTQKPKDFTSIKSHINWARFKQNNLSNRELFASTDVLITSTSSICVEALLSGLHVAILSNRKGPLLNPIPSDFLSDKWEVCYEESELINFILKPSIKPFTVDDSIRQKYMYSGEHNALLDLNTINDSIAN